MEADSNGSLGFPGTESPSGDDPPIAEADHGIRHFETAAWGRSMKLNGSIPKKMTSLTGSLVFSMTYAIHRQNHGCKYTPTFFFSTHIYILLKNISFSLMVIFQMIYLPFDGDLANRSCGPCVSILDLRVLCLSQQILLSRFCSSRVLLLARIYFSSQGTLCRPQSNPK